MNQSPTWRFRTLEEGQKHVEPTHREHLATGGTVEPLIREAIQNSLDATVEGQPTKVVITLGSASPADAQRYFCDLRPHLDAITKSLPDAPPNVNEPVRFLAIEDFNTWGLVGNPALRRPQNADGSKNHFFRFWHSVGQSSGDFKRRGSWGVGKVVFANASRIRTFFGVTRREGDLRPLLMGEAGLTIHSLPDSDDAFDWYGYYALPEPGKQQFVPLPIADLATIEHFSKVFAINRATPGLSILVPYLREEVQLDDLARAVIEQYFLPVLAGRLEVTLRNGSRAIEIARSSIDDAVAGIKWSPRGLSTQSEISALLQLARWQVGLQDSDYVQLNAFGTTGHYSWEPDVFPEGLLKRFSDEFALGKRIAVRTPICVRPKGAAQATEEVRVVLERDEQLRNGDVPHIRSGINISRLREQSGAGVRGILIVGVDPEKQQGDLDKLLQASEGPAHINWEMRGEGFDKARSLYDDAYKVISFMRHFVRGLVEALATPLNSKDTRTLATFFPDYDGDGLAGGLNGASRGKRSRLIKSKPETTATPPVGTIQGIVHCWAASGGGVSVVEGATVRLTASPSKQFSAVTNLQGVFRFEGLKPGEYTVDAHKESVGRAQKNVVLPSEHGVYLELLLRPEPVPKMFVKTPLNDGFAIRGNPNYAGELRSIRVRMAYAAWGGSKTYAPADFTLESDQLTVSFSGVQEAERQQLIAAPNILKFTPTTKAFYVEVRGFDPNRALYVDARSTDEDTVATEVTT